MKIEPQDYLQKLIEVYQAQCNQYLQERIALQAQLDLVLKEVEELEKKLESSEQVDTEVIDVHTNTDT